MARPIRSWISWRRDLQKRLQRSWPEGGSKFFGFPDEMLLDAEGAMRGWDFEQLCAQAGVKVRFVPPDAHYQLGKAERHGPSCEAHHAALGEPVCCDYSR